jgi:hypothetical protein
VNLGLAAGHVRATLLELSAEERQALHRDLDCIGLKGRETKQALAAVD